MFNIELNYLEEFKKLKIQSDSAKFYFSIQNYIESWKYTTEVLFLWRTIWYVVAKHILNQLVRNFIWIYSNTFSPANGFRPSRKKIIVI